MTTEILRLHYSCSLSSRQISKSLGCSRSTVSDYLKRAQKAGLSWPLPLAINDHQIEQLIFQQSSKIRSRPLPDFSYIHTELKRKGVTLTLLWSEYKETNPNGYGQSQFCRLYSEFSKKQQLVMRQDHKAGEKAFSDFAGTKLAITNTKTGEINPAYLFVCTLGASSFTFADLFWDQSSKSWCEGHAAAFSYFNGCPKIVVPDNPKPVVTKACRYEPDINPSFADMAAHFDVVIMPARVRKPKDKAKVEAAVGVATRWILAALRNRTFYSLTEARGSVRELLEKLNDRPFSKILGTRRSQYESLDKPTLKPLPSNPYKYKQFKKVAVNNDYHIEYDGHFYSVPYQLRGATVEIRSTLDCVEIFHLGTSVACHQRSFVENKATTVRDHRPKPHQRYDEYLRPESVIDCAVKIGPSVAALVKEVMKRSRYPELGCRTCSGILSLAHKFGDNSLEEACQRSLTINALSYTAVKSNLSSSRAQPLR